jgi:NAD(P)-dependent dehydrogenase (short-subunit alcohol dehydrogenase family)
MMDIIGKTALVTGANRGLGRAFAGALLEAGASKVYAGARDPSTVSDPRLTPIRLDVTSSRDVAAAAEACGDVAILINNAGAMLSSPILSENSEDALRREMEVNVFGTLAMAKAFAPVLARNGGGAIVNMLSVVSWYVYPFNATYCATKHAALAVTDGLRIQLKAPSQQVAGKTIQGIVAGLDHVLADERAESLWQAVRQDPAKLHAEMQARWDQRPGSNTPHA